MAAALAAAQAAMLSMLPNKLHEVYNRVAPKPEKRQLTPEEIAKNAKEAEQAAAQAEADDVGLGLVCAGSLPSE